MTAKGAAATQLALYFKRRLMPHQGMLDDSKAQTGAALSACALPAVFDSVKTFRQTRNMLTRDTFARITDLEIAACLVGTPRHRDLTNFRRRAHSITNQIRQN